MTTTITLNKIQENIKEVKYLHDDLLTVCILTLQNGFKVIGESACADPKLYSKEKGEKYAKEKAENKVWELMGYELKSKLCEMGKGTVTSRLIGERNDLGMRLAKLRAFLDSEQVYNLDEESIKLLGKQANQMTELLDTLCKRCELLGGK